MHQSESECVSQRIQSETMGYAESHNLPAAFSTLEAGADAVDVSKRYNDFVKALYRDRKDVTQMLAAAKAGVQYCLEAAERGAPDPVRAEALKNKARVIAFNAAANAWPGWGDDGISIEKQHIADAAELAWRSLQLVQEVYRQLQQDGSADAIAFLVQVRTADRLL